MGPDGTPALDLVDFVGEPLRKYFEGVREVCEEIYDQDTKISYLVKPENKSEEVSEK